MYTVSNSASEPATDDSTKWFISNEVTTDDSAQ